MRIYTFTRNGPPQSDLEMPHPVLDAGGRGWMFMAGPFSRTYLESLIADHWMPHPELADEDIVDP
jgi:hypothetical protein